MNRKWIPHIIAAAALVVFIALGLASCATMKMTPAESAARAAAQQELRMEKLREGGNGELRIKNTSQNNVSYHYKLYDEDLRDKGGGILKGGATSPGYSVKGDSSYIVRYRQQMGEDDSGIKLYDEDTSNWRSRSVYVPIGESIVVEIP